MKGYIQVYTGNGKGKTTASLGLAMRAAGAGFNVFIAQFIKKGDYSEIKALRKLSDNITVEQFGEGRFMEGKPEASDIAAVEKGVQCIKKTITSGKYQVIIMDEANVAAKLGVFQLSDLLDIIDLKPDDVELIITGRGAHPDVIERADLVTEMKEIKHYFHEGVPARVGIEK
jgi:cob(I)alamin adenosyltransferase